jgi:two-component system response regulator FlrC
MPEHLIEDMLFGHEKGAFTGALKEHKGLFEQAHGGTIFLDEIGEMPMNLQAKLLRVLQEKKLNRLGGEATIDLDIRVIAATNKDLKLAIEQREFREDLYFRISTFRLRIQPLKDRPGDIVPLVAQSLARHVKGGVPFTVTSEAQVLLQSYPWPGNVRELENVVQRAVVLSGGRTISPAHLMFDDAQMDEQAMPAIQVALPVAQEPTAAAPVVPAPVTPAMPAAPVAYNPMAYTATPIAPVEMREEPVNLDSAVKASELQVIMAAIQSTDSRMEAAAKLGISPRTLRYKLAQMRTRGMNEGASA